MKRLQIGKGFLLELQKPSLCTGNTHISEDSSEIVFLLVEIFFNHDLLLIVYCVFYITHVLCREFLGTVYYISLRQQCPGEPFFMCVE